MKHNLFLGIDVGSTTIKAVLINENSEILNTFYKRAEISGHSNFNCSGSCFNCGKCYFGSIKKYVNDFLKDSGSYSLENINCIVMTGSQVLEKNNNFINYDLKVSEISAHIEGALYSNSNCKAILDVGGQDSKAIIYDEEISLWISKMSGICAAGTGAFLDTIANKLGVNIEEMSQAADYSSELEFSSVCAVLSATSINKFKNKYPLGQIIASACKAQARTIMSGVGELFKNYKGDIIFQGGVASNEVVIHYLTKLSGNRIIVPQLHCIIGALGCAIIAKKHFENKENALYIKDTIIKKDLLNTTLIKENYKSIGFRSDLSRKEYFSSSPMPLVWRNLFFPVELINAFGFRTITLETFAALRAKNQNKIKEFLDNSTIKGFSSETCSFLRVLQGMKIPKADFGLCTSQPCQQGDRIFKDLMHDYGIEDRLFSIETPININKNSIQYIAEQLKECVYNIEKISGYKLDPEKLKQSCYNSNLAKKLSDECTLLRISNPPLIRASSAVYFANVFSQMWGKKELIDLFKIYKEDLLKAKEKIEKQFEIKDTHRILWLHLPPFYNNKLLRYIEEEKNAPIIFEEVNFTGWEELNPENPYVSLAKKILTVGFLNPFKRIENIKAGCIAGKFNGVILYNHGFGRCSMSDNSFQKKLKSELKSINIPLLTLDGDCMDSTIDPCSTYTKIDAYIEALNKKNYGDIFSFMPQTKYIVDYL